MKKFWKSKTLWGIAIAVMPVILPILGVALPPEAMELLNAILVGSGGSLAVYGRVKADQKITFK